MWLYSSIPPSCVNVGGGGGGLTGNHPTDRSSTCRTFTPRKHLPPSPFTGPGGSFLAAARELCPFAHVATLVSPRSAPVSRGENASGTVEKEAEKGPMRCGGGDSGGTNTWSCGGVNVDLVAVHGNVSTCFQSRDNSGPFPFFFVSLTLSILH